MAWFTDLTIADATYGLPILSASTFLITIELGGEAGEHQAQQQEKMKNVMRVLAVAMVPLTMSFPGAVFCYWCTSNSFSCVQTAMFKIPGVKAALGIPGVPLKPLTSDATNSLPQEGMPARISSAPTFGGATPTPMPTRSTDKAVSAPDGHTSVESQESTQASARRSRRRQRRQNRRKK